MLEKVPVLAKGHVIIKIEDDVEYDDHNAILTNSKTIIAKCIGGDTSYVINKIYVYKAGVLKASKLATIAFPTSVKTQFSVVFDLLDFNDTIDEVRLGSDSGGNFSAITGLSITKDNLHKMSIYWTIQIV
jgi:hypothetical protein